MKNLDEIKHFFGLEITLRSTGLFFTQTPYAMNILNKASTVDCKPCITPMSSKQCLRTKTDLLFHDTTLYRNLVDALQYLTISRPKISFAVNPVCQYMHEPKLSHFQAVRRSLKCIKGTLQFVLHCSIGPLHLMAYSDADWAHESTVKKSTTSYCIFLGSNPIFWNDRKQPIIFRSSIEEKYHPLASTAVKLSWIQMLLLNICIHLKDLEVIDFEVIWCDNISAISLASNPILYACSKHIEIDNYFI